VEPPYFTTEMEMLQIQVGDQTQVQISNGYDPNGDEFTISISLNGADFVDYSEEDSNFDIEPEFSHIGTYLLTLRIEKTSDSDYYTEIEWEIEVSEQNEEIDASLDEAVAAEDVYQAYADDEEA
jgi:hypothetical protein